MSTERNRHGAIVVKSGKVIARATNRFRNNPYIILDDHCQSVHAEARAVRQIARPAGCTVYVARWSGRQCSMLSRPCDNCIELMTSLNIKKVVFTDECG